MIHSKKAISQCWQQSHHHVEINNKSKIVENHEVNLPQSPTTSTSTPKDYERLRIKMWEMKHRVCLLEFGLGSVAKLVQDWAFDSPVGNSLKEKEEGSKVDLDNEKKNKEVIKGIGAILKDIETCMQSGFPTSGENFNMEKFSEVAKTTCKSRIFIDEMKSGGNALTAVATTIDGLYKPQVTEKNPVMFQSFSQDQHEKCIKSSAIGLNIESNDRNHYSIVCPRENPPRDPIQSLDALSTLAFVASYKHQNEFSEIGKAKFSPKTQEDLKQKAKRNAGGLEDVTRNRIENPFIYSEENGSDTVPLTKQRRRARRPSKVNLEMGVVSDGVMTKKRRMLK